MTFHPGITVTHTGILAQAPTQPCPEWGLWALQGGTHPLPLSKWMMNVSFPNFSKVS